MDVTINFDLCQGHARCWEICPEVFELDEEGRGSVVPGDIAPALHDQVRLAADNCPERAIVIK